MRILRAKPAEVSRASLRQPEAAARAVLKNRYRSLEIFAADARALPPLGAGARVAGGNPINCSKICGGSLSRSSIARDDATLGCSRLRPAPPAAAEGNFNGTDIATHSDHSFSPQTIRRSEAALTGAVPEGTDPFKKTYRSPQRKPVHTTATNKSFKHLPSTISHLH